MATNQTANYDLNQWLSTDQVLRTDFNADNAKLDAALAGKAEAETVSALQTAVAAKAEQTALDALAASKAEQTAVDALSAQVAALPRIAVGTYVGTGTSDSSGPCRLDFTDSLGRPPQLVVVRPQAGMGDGLVLLQGMTESMDALSGNYGSGSNNTVSWSGASVSWYAEFAASQFNNKGTIYHYFAIG